MAEMVVFALVLGGTLVVSNLATAIITMKVFTNAKFLTRYVKSVMKTCEQVEAELTKGDVEDEM